PIARIRLIIDSLFHESEKPKRKDSISSLRAIANETESLQWLVQEMLDLSMIESGQATIRLVDVPLDELVDGALERLEDQCAAKDIKIKSDLPDNLHVLCDRDLARRVIINLVHNAIKWSPKGEKIVIKAEKQADEVIISVLDNGPGISEDQVDRIFERFYQVDASRSGHEGTGLGLAICRHIVEAHGGRIWAESNKEGGGGRFRFTLLAANSEESEPAISEEMS
ncbi:MAG: sensor histidine kinase, partial [Chloroflexi bacterium]